ncbi:MAG: hypothetical protein GY930_22245, partial [bacterium]|nr:hypothetical protein [bacterium]
MKTFQRSSQYANKLALALFFVLLGSLTAHPTRAQDTGETQGWRALATKGETAFQEGSFEKAFQLYTRALEAAQESERSEWMRFRQADAHLRSLDASQNSDHSETDAALKHLRTFFDPQLEAQGQTTIWAQAAEAIGDHYYQPRRTWGFGHAQQPYVMAMDYWAGSSDVETARDHWLDIIWKMAWPKWSDGVGSYGGRNNWISVNRLEQGLKIAVSDADRARLHFLIARSAQHQGDGPWWDRRMAKALEALYAMGTETGYYDAGLWFEALWYMNTGPWQRDEDGNARRFVKPAKALTLFEVLAKDKRWKKSPYRKHSKNHIKNILSKELGVYVNNAFLTGSKAAYALRVRNLSRVDCQLTPVDLTQHVKLDERKDYAHEWLEEIDTSELKPLRRWSVDLAADSPHAVASKSLAVEGDLPPGAYLLEAFAEGKKDRALVLVSGTAVVLKSSGQDLHAWVTDAVSGKPMQGQEVHAKVRIRDRKGRGFWDQTSATTGADGLGHMTCPKTHDNREVFLAVNTPKGPAFALLSQGDFKPDSAWRVHVVTDRPAYRPEQTVSWKLSARRYTGLRYSTPSGHKLLAKLIGPRGGEIDSAEVTLNDFGSAFGTFETGASMALGQHTLQLRDLEGDTHIASSPLFRLEEYKRPEFEVKVSTPMADEADGQEARPKVFVLGDEVQAEIQANTYFGTPVAGAKVEVVLYKHPHAPQSLHRPRFQWFSDALTPSWQRSSPYNRYNREEVLRKELATDAEGRALLTFATPFGTGQGFRYTVEARVTDASRREVTGSGSVVVLRQSYRVELDLEHKIAAPGQKAELAVLAQDSNGNAMAVEGQLFLYRARWVEIWLDTDHKRIDADTLRKARGTSSFPHPGWRQVRAEYAFEKINEIKLSTDAEGKASWSPILPNKGVYRFTWVSQDARSTEVSAEAWMFAADGDSMQLAYNQQGLQILLDKGAIAEGQSAQILVMSDAS